MKKILSILMCIALLLPVFTVNAQTETQINDDSSAYAKEIALLSYLEVINTDESIVLTDKITRAEFADLVAKFYKHTEGDKKKYYRDVPIDYWAADSINYLLEIGLLTMNEDAIFNPENIISLNEACKILLCAAGYEIIANTNGGYPTGYLNIAYQQKVVPKIGDAASLTYGEAIRLMYNALAMPIYVITDDGYYQSEKDTLLSMHHDVYVDEGVITAVYGASLDSALIENQNDVYIDYERYYAQEGVNAVNSFGDYVEFIYKYNDDDNKDLIYFERIEAKNDDLLISSEDVVAFDSTQYTLTYRKNVDNEKRVNLERGVSVYFNGSFYGGSITEIIDDFAQGKTRGSIKVKKLRGSGYDTLIIKSFRSVVVGYVSTDLTEFHNSYDISDVIDTDNYDNVFVCSATGEETVLQATTPQVISVAESKNGTYLEIIPVTNTISGKVSSLKAGENEIVIDGVEYDIDKKVTDNEVINLGSEYTFYIDQFGYIVYVTVTSEGYIVGYLTRIVCDSENEQMLFKIFDQNGKMDTYTTTDKIRIDKKPYNAEDYTAILDAIPSSAGTPGTQYSITETGGIIPKVARQVIRYKLNAENLLYNIDTMYCSDAEKVEEEFSTLRRDLDGSTSIQYCHGPRRFGYDTLWNNGKTIVFSVPMVDSNGKIVINNKEVKDTDDLYAVKTLFDHDISYYIESYYFDPDNIYADVLVNRRGTTKVDYKTIIVDKVNTEYLEVEDEVRNILYGYQLGASVTLKLDSNLDATGLKRGDIISVNTDTAGKMITSFKKLFDKETNKFVNQSVANDYWYSAQNASIPAYSTWRNSEMNLVKAYVDEISGTFMKMTYDINGDVGFKTFNGSVIIVYDSELDELRVGTVNDLKDYKKHGHLCSLVVIAGRRGGMDYIYVCK